MPNPQLHKPTEQYAARLQAHVQAFIDKGIPATEGELDKRLQQLHDAVGKTMADGLTEAFGIGLHGHDPTTEGKRKLKAIYDTQMTYFDGFLNDLRTAAKLAPMVKQTGSKDLGDALGGFLSRIASYAGAFWSAIWIGLGDGLGQDDEAREPRVMRVLDDQAEHCDDCPGLAGVYESIDDMEANGGIPGDGSTQCLGNCRCEIWVESEYGADDFAPMDFGGATVFTAPLIGVR